MAALAKRMEDLPKVARIEPPVRVAHDGDQPVFTGVHSQQARLRSAFEEPQTTEAYPGAVKLSIIVGGSLALWSVLLIGVAALVHAIL